MAGANVTKIIVFLKKWEEWNYKWRQVLGCLHPRYSSVFTVNDKILLNNLLLFLLKYIAKMRKQNHIRRETNIFIHKVRRLVSFSPWTKLNILNIYFRKRDRKILTFTQIESLPLNKHFRKTQHVTGCSYEMNAWTKPLKKVTAKCRSKEMLV